MAGYVAAILSIVSLVLAVQLHRLFRTGLSFWLMVTFGSMATLALAFCLSTFCLEVAAVADLSVLATGFAGYALSRWLRERFELGAKYGG
ncbi:hypothetical protein RCIX2047 [Methanocella arvoryzae MRE50]|uniref:Uncharacterized protein n=2 Tax=Methanocella TaxID=570266 RepID=Q0W353_METAR|nr:hypothetical protein RCIX2047 [Methanocella arvoryzae MRE50]